MQMHGETLQKRLNIPFYRASRLYRCFLPGQVDKPTTFVHELSAARTRAATDPRDHIFALLGHPSAAATIPLSPKIKADYSKTTRQVFQDMTIWYLEETKDLTVLNAVQNGEVNSFPSWVCDWSSSCKLYTIGTRPPMRSAGFQAAKDTTPIWRSISNDILAITGYELDVIDASSTIIQSGSFRTASPRLPSTNRAVTFLQSLWTTACDRSEFSDVDLYVSGGSSFSAFAQTLLLNGLHQCNKGCRRPITAGQQASHLASYLVQSVPNEDISARVQAMAREGQASYFMENAEPVCTNRKLFRTQKGYFGMGPGTVATDDVVCILLGGVTPFILRSRSECWELVGECYVHGVMGGEATDIFGSEKMKKVFELR